MATKKAASKGASKKAGRSKKSASRGAASKKAAAKKGSSKKAASKKTSSKRGAAGKGAPERTSDFSGKGRCGNWRAWHNRMPPGPATLHVTGTCTFPTQGYKVTLSEAVPQGINPAVLILNKRVVPPTGPVIQIPQTMEVRFSKRTNFRYTHVTIMPDGVTVKVQTVV
ncbi:MAG TPA: hypothetical protein VF736_04300 [Pyrinomonadaceae bacterium]|jgi:hypothetical protein